MDKRDKAKENFRDAIWIVVMAVVAMGGLIIAVARAEDRTKQDRYDEGFKAGVIAAQAVSEQEQEQAAMRWWAGTSDIAGARDRLCWNYYPPKKGK